MNSSLNKISSTETSSTSSQAIAASGITNTTQVMYSVLCTLAIPGNMVTILVFIRERRLLEKSYNILILTLAIADVMTAILLITNPSFVVGDAFPYPTNPVLGEIFCRVIWSRVFLFQLVFFSIYISLVLTVERWVAIVKPVKYNIFFKGKRLILCIFVCWIWSLFLTGASLADTVYKPNLSSRNICEFEIILQGTSFRMALSTLQFFMKMAFPCLSIIGLYVHMIVSTNNSPIASVESKAKLRGKVTRMIGAMSCIFIICITPNQIVLVLAYAGKAILDTKLHHFTAFFNFIPTCANPFIYGLSNETYRRRYKKILFSLCPKVLRGGADAANLDIVLRERRIQPSTIEQ